MVTGNWLDALLWWGIGTGRVARASRIALVWSGVLLAAVTAASAGLGSWTILGWTLWSLSGAVLLSGERPGHVLLVLAGLTTLSWAGSSWARSHPDGGVAGWLPGLILVAGAGVWALRRLALSARGSDPSGADRSWLAALAYALLQSLPLIGAMALVWKDFGPLFVVIALSTMVAVSVCDPMVQAAHALVRRLAERAYSWRDALRRTRRVGTGVALGSIGASVVVAQLCSIAWGSGLLPLRAAGVAVALGATVTGISLLLRDGEARGAAALCCLASVLIAGVMFTHPDQPLVAGWLLVGSALILSAVVCVIAVRRLGSPRSW